MENTISLAVCDIEMNTVPSSFFVSFLGFHVNHHPQTQSFIRQRFRAPTKIVRVMSDSEATVSKGSDDSSGSDSGSDSGSSSANSSEGPPLRPPPLPPAPLDLSDESGGEEFDEAQTLADVGEPNLLSNNTWQCYGTVENFGEFAGVFPHTAHVQWGQPAREGHPVLHGKNPVGVTLYCNIRVLLPKSVRQSVLWDAENDVFKVVDSLRIKPINGSVRCSEEEWTSIASSCRPQLLEYMQSKDPGSPVPVVNPTRSLMRSNSSPLSAVTSLPQATVGAGLDSKDLSGTGSTHSTQFPLVACRHLAKGPLIESCRVQSVTRKPRARSVRDKKAKKEKKEKEAKEKKEKEAKENKDRDEEDEEMKQTQNRETKTKLDMEVIEQKAKDREERKKKKAEQEAEREADKAKVPHHCAFTAYLWHCIITAYSQAAA
jgi:hypothetical protein